MHSLLFNGSQPLTDRQIRAVMRRKAGAEPFPMPLDADPSCSADEGQYTPTEPGSDAELLLAAYALRHARALKSPTEHRYLVVEAGSWGLGNRLFAMVSGLALAVASDRVLLLRDWFAFRRGWATSSRRRRCWRLGRACSNAPRACCRRRAAAGRACARRLRHLALELPRNSTSSTAAASRLLSPSSAISSTTALASSCTCSNTNYLPLLLHNRWPAPRLALLGRRPFHALASWIFQPAPAVRAAADGFLDEQRRHLPTARSSACTSARRTGCACRLPTTGGASTRRRRRRAAVSSPPTPTTWRRRELLDRGAVIVQRRAAFADYAVEADGAGLFDAAVDLLLLASCDTLVVSPMSSWRVCMRGRRRRVRGKRRRTASVRERTAEPFFHHWPDVARGCASGVATAPATAGSAAGAAADLYGSSEAVARAVVAGRRGESRRARAARGGAGR